MRLDYLKFILQSYPPEKSNLLKVLHQLQNQSTTNSIKPEILEEIAKYFKVTKGYLWGLLSYYTMFSAKERGKHIIRLCESPVCTINGAMNLFKYFEEKYNLKVGQTTPDGFLTLESTQCIGRCGRGPSMMLDDSIYMQLTPEKIDEIIDSLKKQEDGSN